MIRAAALAAALLLAPHAAANALDEAIRAHVAGDGYAAQDAAALDARLTDALSPSSAMRPDGDMGPVEKAVLLLDTVEPALERTRHVVRYGQITAEEDGAPLAVSFVQVERYNLGPAIRRETIAAYGADNTADPEEFGVGPHVAWRFVFRPLMGQQAALLEAGRREFTDAEAAGRPCAGRGCLALTPSMDELRPWTEARHDAAGWTSPYEAREASGIAAPARIAAELCASLGIAAAEDGRLTWRGPEQPDGLAGRDPFLFLVIDRNLGQDYGSDAMIGQTRLNDDELSELWWRRAEVDGAAALFQARVAWRR